MAEGAKDLTAIGLEILQTARNELYLNLPYLDAALCSLDFQPGGGMTLSLATDGETLYYDGSFLGGAVSPLPNGGGPGISARHPALYAAASVEEAGQGGGTVGSCLRRGGGEHSGHAGLPLPERRHSACQGEVLRRVPGGDAGC